MNPKNNLLLICIFFIAFISCSKSVNDTSIYFGGSIINPKTNNVILYSLDKVIDTFYIDSKNKFISKLDSIKEGLYSFAHGDETQFLYLKSNDSLTLSLNTWNFDESLVFSGTGAERNNMLIDCFLQYEKDKKLFYKYNSLKASSFKTKVDSLITIKIKTYKEYTSNYPEDTEKFKDILKTALTYPVYTRIERYPSAHAKRMKLNDFPEISDDFYSYRNELKIDKNELMYYSPYSMYVTSFLYNSTYSLGHKPMQNNFTSNFTVDLLKTIDVKIQSKVLKNAFLKQTLISHFYKKSTCDINNKEFDTFLSLSSNKKDKELIKKILNDNHLVHVDHKINNFIITDFNNKNHSTKKFLNKNTLLFFWSLNQVSKSYVSSRVNYLQKKYPDVQFLTIKIDGDKLDKIEKLDIKKQFFINQNSEANLFLTSKMTRSILINKMGFITNGFASISSNNIYTQLDELNKN